MLVHREAVTLVQIIFIQCSLSRDSWGLPRYWGSSACKIRMEKGTMEPRNIINIIKCACYNNQFVICLHYTRYLSLVYMTQSLFYLRIFFFSWWKMWKITEQQAFSQLVTCQIVKCSKQVNTYVTIIKKARKRFT